MLAKPVPRFKLEITIFCDLLSYDIFDLLSDRQRKPYNEIANVNCQHDYSHVKNTDALTNPLFTIHVVKSIK